MRNNYFVRVTVFLLLFITSCVVSNAANQSSSFWNKKDANSLQAIQRTWYPEHYSAFSLDLAAMKSYLLQAPEEKNVALRQSSFIIELPLPEGGFHSYTIVESPVMEQGLAD